ncbi:unnamed protein product [Trichogramma brassicae]|uniref:Uncharacterized protein n=1 Tax=Trichogramma brassicae TaxID=86971 RepID=A0A6H5IXW0_9HYME|nr:unnamed protein product [Trichogramma brassicae]
MIKKMILLQSCAMEMTNYSAVWKNSSNSNSIFSSNSTVNNNSTADPPLYLITLLLLLLIMQFIVLQLSFHPFGPINQACGLRRLTRSSYSQTSLTSLRRLGVGSAPLLGSKLALVRASISCVRRRCVPLPTSGRRCQIVYARVHYFTPACTSPAGRPASRARIITSPCGRSCLTANYLTSTYNHWPLRAISHTYLGPSYGGRSVTHYIFTVDFSN